MTDPEVINPFTEKPLPEKHAGLVLELRGVRRGARNAKRSGHPGKRAEAARVEAMVPGMIRDLYWKDATSS